MDKIKELIITKSKIILVIISLLFLIPTIVFYYNSKSLYNFYFENTFFLNDFNRLIQIISFIAVIILHFIFYSIIIKNKDNLFKDMKSMYVYIFLISIIFTLIIPFLSSDPFYYLGIGRLNSTYYQNPYYVSMRDFRNNTNTQVFINDHAFLKGFFNVWSDTTVVYGPIWTIICAILAKLSFSNVDLGIYIFKIFNLIMHMINCYLLYKISNKKIFPLLYGLNLFVLIEGLSNAHNDLFLLTITLLSFYFLLKNKNIFLSILCISIATNIKFITILFLPIIVLYYCQEKDVLHRFIDCIKYGLLFLILYLVPFIVYYQDIEIFKCMLVQQTKYTRGLYNFIYFLTFSDRTIHRITTFSLIIFVIIYISYCFNLLFKKEISWKNEMHNSYYLLLYFIFLLITNFQSWYLIWLFMTIIWLNPNEIRIITKIQYLIMISHFVFIIKYPMNKDTLFFALLLISFDLCYLLNKENLNKFKKKDIEKIKS